MGAFKGNNKLKLFAGDKKVKKAYLGTEKIYSAGNIVTYCVDNGITYQEEVDSDTSCLSPTTFTPSKSGWTFVGWREDTTASSDVLSSKIMGDKPIMLYAVFKQDVTLTYYDNSTSPKYKYGTKYYNNGTPNNPAWFMAQSSKSGWTARGWATGTAGNASVAYNNSTTITITADTTIYGLYQQDVPVRFLAYNYDETRTLVRYYNSYGNYKHPYTTIPAISTYSGWYARGWSYSTAANGSIADLGSGSGGWEIDFDTSPVLFGCYSQTIYLYYNGNGSTGGSVSTQSGTRYWNAYGNYSNPTFTLASNGYSRTNYTFTGWNLGAVGGTITLSASATAYAQWRILAITSSLQASVSKSEQISGYRYSWYDNTYDLTGISRLTFNIDYYYFDNFAEDTDTDYDDDGDGAGDFCKYFYNTYVAGVFVSSDKSSINTSSEHSYGGNSYVETMSGSTTLTIDVSGLSGNYYIGVGTKGYNSYNGGLLEERTWPEGWGTHPTYNAKITKVTFS